ncbi:MAG TPA: hypothetical protein P5157_02765 [Paludibacteraceae bacterium]|jgi:hypothetical protein|nr:hypothetical protein [Paludibacteraceae bacterium]OPZ02708.1 MAG: hypothetical protein BWZ11_00685 [Bacteroidetes bacterium ADurb.BinA395]MBP8967153.1 hypothetical protein [Paludibacteraceae bacterium]HOF97918.1 hypothetical protein [Paludibacteraceae bacterium]HOJ66279.1 hypothetical protein [Paludibacteraceae bacterium]
MNKPTLKSLLKTLLYGLGVFGVYIVIIVLLRLFSGRVPDEAVIFNFFTKNDLLIGLLLACILTFTHQRNKKI